MLFNGDLESQSSESMEVPAIAGCPNCGVKGPNGVICDSCQSVLTSRANRWDRWLFRAEVIGFMLIASVLLLVSTTIGVALGNGIPMARSATAAMYSGFQLGMQNCPCAAKAKAEELAKQGKGAVPFPTSAGQTLVRKADGSFMVIPGKSEAELLGEAATPKPPCSTCEAKKRLEAAGALTPEPLLDGVKEVQPIVPTGAPGLVSGDKGATPTPLK